MKSKLIVFTFLSLNITSLAFAQLSFNDAVFPELATSARAQALGNAFIGKVDDSTSAFYNPAGLGTVRYGHLHLANIHLESNKGLVNSAAGGRALDAVGNVTKGFSLDGLRELTGENRGVLTHSRFQTTPNVLFRFFSAGFLLNRQTKTYTGEEEDANFEYADRIDFGPYAALNISLFGGVLKLGATGVLLNRHEAIGEAESDEPFELDGEDYKKGSMAYIVAGGRLTLPIALMPTFAATLHNAGDNGFSGRAAGAPDKIKQQIDIGFSLTPQISNTTRIHFEADYKDIGSAHDDVATVRKILFGMEIDFARAFFIRAGYGDGFGSGGIGIRTRKLEFDLTTYAVDTSNDDFQGKEDRRYSFSLSTGF